MKKILLLGLSLLVFPQAPLWAAEKMVVMRVTGQPQIVRGNQTMAAVVGSQCQTGDVLKTTTPGCSMDMALNGLAGCRVLPSSECVIVNGASSDMHLQIKSGNAVMNLKKLPKGSSFKVETPTAVAAVRGTQFWGRVNMADINNPVTTFAVRQGFVTIFDKKLGKTFSLRKGQALDIPKDETKTPTIRAALDDELKAMDQASSIQTSA